MLYVDLGPLYQGFGMQTKHLSAASGAAGTFANSRVQNFSFPAIKRDANSSGHLPTTIDVYMHVYMQSFVHVYAMIITYNYILYKKYSFIYSYTNKAVQVCHVRGECKGQLIVCLGLDPFGKCLMWISMRSPRWTSLRFFAVLPWCRGCCTGRLVTCQLRYCRRYVSTRGAPSRHCHDGCSLATFSVGFTLELQIYICPIDGFSVL